MQIISNASSGFGCSSEAGAKVIDAYAAVLAVDDFDINVPNSGRVRKAILDVSPNLSPSNPIFDVEDLRSYITAFERADGAIDYSRFDLNGDGRTGGTEKSRFDLNNRVDLNNQGNPDPFRWGSEPVSKEIEGGIVKFEEKALTDMEVLCYYAYSNLYDISSSGMDPDGTQRRELLKGKCFYDWRLVDSHNSHFGPYVKQRGI